MLRALILLFLVSGTALGTTLDAQRERLCVEILSQNLSDAELAALVKNTFAPRPGDLILYVTDLPSTESEGNRFWRDRIDLVKDWAHRTARLFPQNPVNTLVFKNTGRHNGTLPTVGHVYRTHEVLPYSYADVKAETLPLEATVGAANVVMALNEYSITGVLRSLSEQKQFSRDFQAASMPGFHRGMIPGLGVDYSRVQSLSAQRQAQLANAVRAQMSFQTRLNGMNLRYNLSVDLRNGVAMSEGGVTHNLAGQHRVTNLPAGEAWKVPNESAQSETKGILPIQFSPGGEVVLLQIKANRVLRVLTNGPDSLAFREKIQQDPLYGNLAEFGVGVLNTFGLEPPRIGPPEFPVSNTLLTEKLFIHLAFGMSSHLKGSVSAGDFTVPSLVHHTDYVFIPAEQPLVKLTTVDLIDATGASVPLVREGTYVP